MGRGWKNVEKMMEKNLDCLEQTVSRVCILILLVGAQKVVRSKVEKICIISENT